MVFFMVTNLLLVGTYLLCRLLLVQVFIAILVSIIVAGIPSAYVFFKIRHKKATFEAHFVEALSIIRNALQAGQGLSAALGIVARDAPWPINDEFQHVIREIEYGFSFEVAITRFEKRIRLPEVSFFSQAIKIQHQAGGNLVQTINNIEKIVRIRFEMKREINTLSAQGRASGFVLCSVPVILVVILNIIAPGYFDPILHDPMGKKVMIFTAILGVIGVLWIRKIVNCKI